MGKELSMARSEEERQSMLLASTVNGKLVTASSSGDKRKKKSRTSKGNARRATKDTQTKSKSSRKVKGADASTTEQKGRRRYNPHRKSDRGDEGKNTPPRRTAQELGITYPGSFCDESKLIPHHWCESERIDNGSLFQCSNCRDYLWLPQHWTAIERLSKLMDALGKDKDTADA